MRSYVLSAVGLHNYEHFICVSTRGFLSTSIGLTNYCGCYAPLRLIDFLILNPYILQTMS